MLDTERNSEVSTPARYQTYDDEVDTLDISSKIQHVLPSRIPVMTNQQVREALAM